MSCQPANNSSRISSLIHQKENEERLHGEGNTLHWLFSELLKETICFPSPVCAHSELFSCVMSMWEWLFDYWGEGAVMFSGEFILTCSCCVGSGREERREGYVRRVEEQERNKEKKGWEGEQSEKRNGVLAWQPMIFFAKRVQAMCRRNRTAITQYNTDGETEWNVAEWETFVQSKKALKGFVRADLDSSPTCLHHIVSVPETQMIKRSVNQLSACRHTRQRRGPRSPAVSLWGVTFSSFFEKKKRRRRWLDDV